MFTKPRTHAAVRMMGGPNDYARPLSRRRWSTAAVAVREPPEKPCLRLRRMSDGWKVRLMARSGAGAGARRRRRGGGRVVPVVVRRRRGWRASPRRRPRRDRTRPRRRGVEPGRDDVLGRPERGDDGRACACATSAKGFSRWALRMALFVLRGGAALLCSCCGFRKSAAGAAPAAHACCAQLFWCSACSSLWRHAATKRGAPAKFGCCGVAKESSPVRVCCLGRERGRSAVDVREQQNYGLQLRGRARGD